LSDLSEYVEAKCQLIFTVSFKGFLVILFFKVIAVSMQPDLLMSLISTSECHGVVIDIGESECRALAIAHGRAVMHSYRSKWILGYVAPAINRSIERASGMFF
jgi:hypothetical protein